MIARLPFDLGRLRRGKLTLLLCMLALMTLGVCFVYSANSIRDSVRLQHLYRAHAELALLGLGAYLLLAYTDFRHILRFGWPAYGISLLLLVAVLAVGVPVMGARRWIFGIQPGELAKLSTILVLASFLGRPNARRDIWEFLLVLAVAALPMLLIAKQPDLGTALVFVPTVLAMLFAAGTAPRALLVVLLGGAVIAGLVLWAVVLQERPTTPPRARALAAHATSFMDDYQHKRLLVYLYPERDPHGLGWNKRQSEMAVGSGGLWGKGFLKGDQNLLGYLPQQVSANDFIFSVLAEEKGFAGSMAVLLLFAGIVFPGMAVAASCREDGGRLMGVGVLALLFSHVFINVAMTIGLMPVTGLPLPFVSYGRTFMLTMTVALGLLQSVAVHGHRAPPHF